MLSLLARYLDESLFQDGFRAVYARGGVVIFLTVQGKPYFNLRVFFDGTDFAVEDCSTDNW